MASPSMGFSKEDMWESMRDPILVEKKELLEDQKILSEDETGAKRELFFHKDLGEFFDVHITPDASGKLKLSATGKEASWLATSLRDLQRINSNEIGGHLLGDQVLKASVSDTKEFISEEDEIYRIRGSDFTTFIKNSTLLDSAQEKIKNWEHPIAEDEIPAKLSCVSFTAQEAVDTFNTLIQSNISGDDRQEFEENPKKKFGEIVSKGLEFQREFQKAFDTGIYFMDIYETKKHVTRAENEFVMYGEYLFRRTFFDDHSKFTQENILNLKEACLEIAKEKTFGDSPLESKIWEILRGAKDIENTLEPQEYPSNIGFSPEEEKVLIETFQKQQAYYKTERAKTLQDLNTAVKGLTAQLKDQNVDNKDTLSQIDTLIGATKNPTLKGFIHHELVSEVQKMQNIIASPSSSEGRKTIAKERLKTDILSSVQIAYENMILSIDKLTGLKNKTSFDKDFEYLVNKGPITLVSFDLAFLKYFNEVGNREMGDLAIQKSGWILEQVKQKLAKEGIDAEIYRIGGDEFSMILKGAEDIDIDKKNLQKMMQILKETREEINSEFSVSNAIIPPNSKATKLYNPEEIQFNTGYSTNEAAELGFRIITTSLDKNEGSLFSKEDLKEFEKKGRLYKRILRSVHKKMADGLLDHQKSFERFRFLTSRYKQLINENPEDIPKFSALVSFSGKSMKGKTLEDIKEAAKLLEEIPKGKSYEAHQRDVYNKFVRQTSTIAEKEENPIHKQLIAYFKKKLEIGDTF